MHMGGDRVSALIGAALVEDALVESIKAFLVYDEPKAALFYDQGAPFGTFSNRIVAARAMGLLTEREQQDLDLIRDLRNQFAHALQPIGFGDEGIQMVCDKLADYEYPDMPKGREVSSHRLKYEMACCGIWVLVMQRGCALRTKKIKKLEASLRLV
ncbi:hypothetical protein [Novosphingobium sp. B 225]|uniref:hypothetical protein n=1 Tax=Novosphingobium sp. B 225 TaxID=1961849 RepID=UPI001124D50F|nr:hypothetical protein [Novosphingobium sp. B 225]